MEITLINNHKIIINVSQVRYLNHEVIEETDRYFVKLGEDLLDITKVSYDNLVIALTVKKTIPMPLVAKGK